MPKISVIIPVYKVEEYLRECVDSVLNQNYADFEVILVDDGSPDSCPAICDEYATKDDRVTVVHKKNGGLSSARNAGLPLVTGDFIWFIDSDDYVCENAFQMIEKCFETDADIIHFGFLCKQYSGNIAKSSLNYTGMVDKNKMAEFAKTSCSKHILTYVWRNVYKTDFIKNNGIKFVDGLSYAEDSAFNSEAFFRAEKIYFSEYCPYVYRDRKDGISKDINKRFDEKIIDHFNLYDKIRDENYEKYCVKKSKEYYEDAGRFILLNVYYSSIVKRIYRSKSKNKFHCFKKLNRTDMVKKAFRRFDINKIKSKSLDWWMFWAVKHKMYFAAHLMCKYILFK